MNHGGGAQNDLTGMSKKIKNELVSCLNKLSKIKIEELLELRYQKYRNM